MKIKFSMTLDVDAKAWADEYGIDSSEVRDDVIAYLRTLVEGSYHYGSTFRKHEARVFCDCGQQCARSRCESSDSGLRVRDCWCNDCAELRREIDRDAYRIAEVTR